jgi:L-ascorbate metabolism protein UlaG (beta-lactamase superfamily)
MLKRGLTMIIYLVLLLLASGLLFVGCAPQLGAVGESERILNSNNFRDDKFHNLVTTQMKTFTPEMGKASLEYFSGKQYREPEIPLPTVSVDAKAIGETDNLKITWLGHSTCLIEIDGKIILTDPVFSERASPFSFMGPKRFASELPIKLEELPNIDVVLISHDHYDHLDHQSILTLKEKTSRFYVPLGVGGHLQRWGVAAEKIIELDWWEERSIGGLTLAATPTRHFSGRGLKRDRTLWASWVIMGEKSRVYFGGDSGYFDGFKQIGQKYGPFDITMLESGAYNEAWPEIHMMPEQTVQAHIDLQGKLLLPIHWGKFNLALHAWTEPIERLLKKAAEHQSLSVATPLIGEAVLPGAHLTQTRWWEDNPKLSLLNLERRR